MASITSFSQLFILFPTVVALRMEVTGSAASGPFRTTDSSLLRIQKEKATESPVVSGYHLHKQDASSKRSPPEHSVLLEGFQPSATELSPFPT